MELVLYAPDPVLSAGRGRGAGIHFLETVANAVAHFTIQLCRHQLGGECEGVFCIEPSCRREEVISLGKVVGHLESLAAGPVDQFYP